MTELAFPALTTAPLATSRTAQRLLAELAQAADEVSRSADRGGSWTDTAGTDRLRALHPHLLPGPTSRAHDADMATTS